MTVHFLPDRYTRVVQMTIVVPLFMPEGTVLGDPSNGWLIIPERVEITLTREEGTSRGTRERAYVAAIGPRRLKSGKLGKEARISGWERARNEGFRGYSLRPDELTAVLVDNLPAGWDPALLDLPRGTS